jgi:hypothetical protein
MPLPFGMSLPDADPNDFRNFQPGSAQRIAALAQNPMNNMGQTISDNTMTTTPNPSGAMPGKGGTPPQQQQGKPGMPPPQQQSGAMPGKGGAPQPQSGKGGMPGGGGLYGAQNQMRGMYGGAPQSGNNYGQLRAMGNAPSQVPYDFTSTSAGAGDTSGGGGGRFGNFKPSVSNFTNPLAPIRGLGDLIGK